MKALVLLLFLFPLSSSLTFSQPVLTKAIHQPQVGDLEVRNYLTFPSINEGADGVNVTWDYSSASFYISDSVQYRQPTVSELNTFPGSNIVEEHCQPEALYTASGCYKNYFFYINYDDSTNFTGWIMDNIADYGPSRMSDDPMMHRVFPFQYGDTLFDSTAGNFSGFAYWNFRGATQKVYSGYGTLILPSDTFTNVIKIVEMDSCDVPIPFVQFPRSVWFYQENLRFPVLTILRGDQSDAVYTSQSFNATAIHKPEQKSAIQIFPNPAREKVSVSFENEIPGEYDFQLVNAWGETLKSWRNFHAGKNAREEVDVSTFSPGVYFLRIKGENVFAAKRLVIQN